MWFWEHREDVQGIAKVKQYNNINIDGHHQMMLTVYQEVG